MVQVNSRSGPAKLQQTETENTENMEMERKIRTKNIK